MKTAIAIMTYNRLPALQVLLGSMNASNPTYGHLGIFEDGGVKDETRLWLQEMFPGKPVHKPEILAYQHGHAFLGMENLGVAGNSNRAMWWFMHETDADHLLLLNDDLEFIGDACAVYREAHEQTDVGLLCFCDFDSEQFRCTPMDVRGVRLKLLNRMTGIGMSITRKLVETIGYYDTAFGPFSEEHCDYTVRARFAGAIDVQGVMQYCLDVDATPAVLKHQEVDPCVSREDRVGFEEVGNEVMTRKSRSYAYSSPFVPFTLKKTPLADGHQESGTMSDALAGYEWVNV